MRRTEILSKIEELQKINREMKISETKYKNQIIEISRGVVDIPQANVPYILETLCKLLLASYDEKQNEG